MSALGQKRTFESAPGMSALHPKADISCNGRKPVEQTPVTTLTERSPARLVDRSTYPVAHADSLTSLPHWRLFDDCPNVAMEIAWDPLPPRAIRTHVSRSHPSGSLVAYGRSPFP